MKLANFRELGGYTTTSGQKVQSNRLLRSGEVFQIDEESRKALKEHQLSKIIDFRSKDEIKKRPDDTFDEVSYHWIDILKEVSEKGSKDDLLNITDLTVVDNYMKETYHHLVLNEGAQKGYRMYFEELLNTEQGSVLFHCFAGKDRTGVAAALTLDCLGVPRETIYQDYIQTNIQRQKPNVIFLNEAAQRGLSEKQLAAVKVALEVKKEYLEYAYQLIDENFGGFTGYAKEALKLNRSARQLLRQLYLV